VAPVLKMLVATGLMTAACLGIQLLPAYPHGSGRTVWTIQLVVLMGTGASVYLGACALMGVDTLSHFIPKRVRAGSERHGR
jgi:hypothetical protein